MRKFYSKTPLISGGITAAPEIKHLHDRIPIILNEDHFEDWIAGDTSADEAAAMLSDNRGSELVSYRIGREVNSSKASGAELIEQLSDNNR